MMLEESLKFQFHMRLVRVLRMKCVPIIIPKSFFITTEKHCNEVPLSFSLYNN